MSTGQSVSVDPRHRPRRNTTKGVGMFKSFILRWADSIHQREAEKYTPVGIDASPRIESSNGINFTLYKANGGTVVETRYYDEVKDRSQRGLYVISDERDLGNEITKIITMEALKI